MNLYDLCYFVGGLAILFYALSSFAIDFGNSVEEDWYSKYPNEYSSLAQHDRLAAYSRISCNWNHHPTVGQVKQILIQLFKNSNKGTLPHNLTESDEISVKIVSENENFEVKCSQDVRKMNGDVKCTKSRENEVIYSFVPQKAGLYNIYVYINGEKMFVCPIRKYFLPEKDLGIETTSLDRELIPLLCVSGQKSCTLIVNLKDRFGNALNGNKIDTSKLSWQFKHESSYDSKHIKLAIRSLNPKTSSPKMIMKFEVDEPGIFQGVLLYKHVLLPNCHFTLVCVTQEEDHQIMNAISEAIISPLEYKATLWEDEPIFDLNIGLLQTSTLDWKSRSNCQLSSKKTEVLMLLTPSTIYIQDRSFDPFKTIPDIKYTFAINLNCRIRSLFPKSKTDMVTFEMVNTESGEDVKLEMSHSDLRTFVAIFSALLLNNTAGEERFLKKHNNFFKEIQNRQGIISRDRRIEKIDISRENTFLATLQQTKLFTRDDWKTLFIITLREETMAYDKALRQWLQISFQEIFQFSKVSEGNYVGLFVPVGETLLIHPYPGNRHLSDLTSYQSYWKLTGQIIGKCIFEFCVGGYTGNFQILNARFSRSFLSQILGVQPNYKVLRSSKFLLCRFGKRIKINYYRVDTYSDFFYLQYFYCFSKHFEKDDPGFYRSHVCPILSNDVRHMNLYFEDIDERLISPLCPKKIEIICNGLQIKVTNENKLYYLNSLARFRLAERMKREIRWIREGLGEIIPLDSFFIFSENELELLLCGSSSYTIEDMLGDNYDSISTTEKKILGWYAEAVNSMSQDNKGRLLQFTTGSSLLPSGSFSELDPPFQVEFIIDDDFGGFPTSNIKRINCICLRNHKNYENFEKSLISAINNGCSGYFST